MTPEDFVNDVVTQTQNAIDFGFLIGALIRWLRGELCSPRP